MCWGPSTGTHLKSLEPWLQPEAGKASAWMFRVLGMPHPAHSKHPWQGLPGTRRSLLARGSQRDGAFNLGTSFGPGRASTPGAVACTDAAPRLSGAAGSAAPNSAWGELGTGGTFRGGCQLLLFASFSSSPLIAEQRALWLRTTGNVTEPHAPGQSAHRAGSRSGRSLEAGAITSPELFGLLLGVDLGLEVHSLHPPARLTCRRADARCHGCPADGAPPAAASLPRHQRGAERQGPCCRCRPRARGGLEKEKFSRVVSGRSRRLRVALE